MFKLCTNKNHTYKHNELMFHNVWSSSFQNGLFTLIRFLYLVLLSKTGMLRFISTMHTTLRDKACQWHATSRWFSSGSLFSSTNKSDRHDITEILLKVALNTIIQPTKPENRCDNKNVTISFILVLKWYCFALLFNNC
jgi:hypothetical protein